MRTLISSLCAPGAFLREFSKNGLSENGDMVLKRTVRIRLNCNETVMSVCAYSFYREERLERERILTIYHYYIIIIPLDFFFLLKHTSSIQLIFTSSVNILYVLDDRIVT